MLLALPTSQAVRIYLRGITNGAEAPKVYREEPLQRVELVCPQPRRLQLCFHQWLQRLHSRRRWELRSERRCDQLGMQASLREQHAAFWELFPEYGKGGGRQDLTGPAPGQVCFEDTMCFFSLCPNAVTKLSPPSFATKMNGWLPLRIRGGPALKEETVSAAKEGERWAGMLSDVESIKFPMTMLGQPALLSKHSDLLAAALPARVSRSWVQLGLKELKAREVKHPCNQASTVSKEDGQSYKEDFVQELAQVGDLRLQLAGDQAADSKVFCISPQMSLTIARQVGGFNLVAVLVWSRLTYPWWKRRGDPAAFFSGLRAQVDVRAMWPRDPAGKTGVRDMVTSQQAKEALNVFLPMIFGWLTFCSGEHLIFSVTCLARAFLELRNWMLECCLDRPLVGLCLGEEGERAKALRKALAIFRNQRKVLSDRWRSMITRCCGAFPGMPPEVVWAIAEQAEQMEVAAGEVFVKEGDEDEDLILIEEGIAIVEKTVANGDRPSTVEIGQLGATAIIGDIALIGASLPRAASVRAGNATEILRIPAGALSEVLRRFPGALQGITSRLKEASLWQVHRTVE
eukprot:s146_g22.t1